MLFLIALFFNLIGMEIYKPILNGEDYLQNAFPNRVLAIIGLLIDAISIPALVLIPIVAYPILKQYNERLALAYVSFRAIEGVLFFFGTIKYFSIISLSKSYLSAGSQNTALYQTLGDSIHATTDWSTLIYIVVFTMGSAMFYYVLYQSRLIPRFISIWGLASCLLLCSGAIIGMFDIYPLTKVMAIFAPSFALNELVMAIWLIVKGFDSQALANHQTVLTNT